MWQTFTKPKLSQQRKWTQVSKS